MASCNDITGDIQQTKGILCEAARNNYDRIFPPKKIIRGSFKWCSDTRKYIPKHEWVEKNPQKPKGRAPMMFCDQFKPFENMIDGTIINNKREHQYDLEKNECRVYEGRGAEQKEVDRYLKAEDSQFVKDISDSVDETAWEIENNYSRPGNNGSVGFDMVGED